MAKAIKKQGNKSGKGKTSQVRQGKTAIAAAVKSLGQSSERIFAIEEVGQWLPQIKKADGIALRYTLETLCSGLKDGYCEAMDAIAHLKHPATALLLKACEALDAITLVVEERDGDLTRAELRAISRVVLTFLGESVRWIEQAQEALGSERSALGWLDGLQHVDGLPDGEFHRLDERQRWVAHHFNRLNDEKQQVVSDFITAALKGA